VDVKIAAIVPHLLKFGGIRRFLEIGNVFEMMGHDFTLYPTEGTDVDWYSFLGKIEPPTGPAGIHADVCLIGDPPSFKRFGETACPTYVYVIAGEKYLAMYARQYEVHPPGQFVVNNRVFLKHFPEAHLIEGGVNTYHFEPEHKLRVLYYAGRGRIKGEATILEALGDLKNINLIPIEDVANGDLPKLYCGADYFVCWESRPGWSNTAAEALSCRVPVVTNGVNCEPFSKFCIRLSDVNDLRAFFVSPMEPFSWTNVCGSLLNLWKEHGIG